MIFGDQAAEEEGEVDENRCESAGVSAIDAFRRERSSREPMVGGVANDARCSADASPAAATILRKHSWHSSMWASMASNAPSSRTPARKFSTHSALGHTMIFPPSRRQWYYRSCR